MRNLALVFILMLLAHTTFAEYRCKREEGCVEETSATHDIGGGATIVLPEGWRFYRFPAPPEPEGVTILRMEKDGVVIAIDGFPNLDKRTVNEEWLRGLLAKATQPHVLPSREKQFNYISISRNELIGGYASFTSNDGERPFHVLGRGKDASVTTLIASFKLMIFSVSIVSNRAPDKDYQDALDAIRNMR
jgi:hypothetical protein